MPEIPAHLTEPAFDSNAMRVLTERYFAKHADGSLETPREFLWRVASAIAEPEKPYAAKLGADPEAVATEVGHAFYDMMAHRDFLPNTPCLVNAGRPLSMLSACFVLPVPDSIDGIFYSVKAMALIQKSGGGTGYAFSELRHQGAEVVSTGRDASGPVSFMKVFNAATDSIKQGGVRRGANMGVLRVDHPDVFAFMRSKKELDAENRALWNRLSDSGRYAEAELTQIRQELLQTQFNNFNISIGVTDAFMKAVETDTAFELIDPRTKAVVRTVPAREIWDGIVEGAWQNGEPGVLFLDHPEWNPLPGLGPIQATNPCVTADTWIATSDGARRAGDLVGEPFGALVDGVVHASSDRGFFFTGIKPVFRIETTRGYALSATADHPVLVERAGETAWRPVGELAAGDAIVLHDHANASWNGRGSADEGWLLGNLLRDGHLHRRGTAGHAVRLVRETVGARSDFGGAAVLERDLVRATSTKLAALAKSFGMEHGKRVTDEIESASSDFAEGFLGGWFDADGSVQGSAEEGVSVRLASSEPADLESAQRMLLRLGIVSTISCRSQHELVISRRSLQIFAERIRFRDPLKAARLIELGGARERAAHRDRRTAVVTSIAALGSAPVFDCSIPGVNAFDANGLYVHNCGEQALHGWDSCNLGSINVGNFYSDLTRSVDWERLGTTTALAIRFLDNVIDANLYPLDEIRDMVTGNRRVGLGIMGYAELLIKLGIAYGSPEAVAFARDLMKYIQDRAIETSERLAGERGDFPNKHLSVWADDARPRRNAALLSIAPTGTISMIAGCSFGCEPFFGMCYTKHVMKDAEGRPQHLYYVIPLFEEIAKREGFFSEALLGEIENNRGSVRGLASVPERWQQVFTVAADVTVDQHIDMLAAFQRHTCNAVSKTINAPNDDTRENVSRAIFRAYEAGCKGFTYYRDGSRTEQVVTFSKDGDIKGGNRDVAAATAPAPAAQTAPVPSDVDLDALLAKASALLERR